jgi:hypothetical protein
MTAVRLRSVALGLLLCAMSLPVVAQEPRPVRLTPASFNSGSGVVDLAFAWRYAPGDQSGRELPGFDDSRWAPVAPALGSGAIPPGAWTGVGWFRRHILVSPVLQSKAISLRFAAPGLGRVYLDGKLVLVLGEGDGAPREIPSARSDVVMIGLKGPSHVIAVRYVYPQRAPRPAAGIGFQLSLASGATTPNQPRADWTIALRGAIFALPLILALLHLALYAFDPRARENLFYGLEMLAFTGLILDQYRDVLLATDAQRALVDRIAGGFPSIAILFGMLVYYSVRTRRWPKTWPWFAGVGVVLYGLTYTEGVFHDYGWMVYFGALVIEIIRLERGNTITKRREARFYLVSFAIFGFTVVLQMFVNFGLLESVAGVSEVYVFGILASAIGMSLYLASTLGQSRVHEAENARKTEELAQARELQLSMLPKEMPRVSGLDIAAATQTAAEVGGDYYDARSAGDGALLFAFGDATGHGLSAGIVVTAAKALFTSLTPTEPPGRLLAKCDRGMAAMHLPTLRMCLSLALISHRRVTVSSAAMPPLLIWRAATGEVEELGTGGLPLGSRMESLYEERTTALAGGDTILFASDGFAELTNADGLQLGYDGVIASFRRCAQARTAREVIDRLLADVSFFRSDHPQDDDITFVAVRVEASLG